MIALELIRSNPDEIVARYKKREKNVDLTEILEIDAKRREMTEFLFRHEGDFGSSLDAFYFDEMAEAIMAGTWQAVLHED